MNVEPRDPPSAPTSSGETPPTTADSPQSTDAPAAPVLTPEEQMALFEQELKETDWGHQPC